MQTVFGKLSLKRKKKHAGVILSQSLSQRLQEDSSSSESDSFFTQSQSQAGGIDEMWRIVNMAIDAFPEDAGLVRTLVDVLSWDIDQADESLQSQVCGW